MNKVGRYLNYVRLALFPLSYGIVGALMGSTLNRVLIVEIGFAAVWVGFFFAASDLIAPVRVWLGYRSDGFPLLGRRRESYIVLGALVTGASIFLVTQLAVAGEVTTTLLLLSILLAFVLYGIGRNLAHNSFQALLADKFKGDARPRAITGYEVATVLGLIIGAGAISGILSEYDPTQLMSVAIAIATISFILSLVATIRQEPQTQTSVLAAATARRQPFSQVFREVVWKDRQVRLFFVLIMFTFVGTLAQDVFLEPYGGLVLGMDIGETAALTQFWGIGLIVSMLLSGFVLIKWLGYMRVLRIGLVVSIVVFLGVIAAGSMGNVGLFRGLVLVMGLGTGLAGAGMLSIIINFTSNLRAGLLLGVWGFANQLGRAAGSLMAGGVVDGMLRVTGGNAFAAYATVFAVEVGMLVVALYLSRRLNVTMSRAKQEEADLMRRVPAEAMV